MHIKTLLSPGKGPNAMNLRREVAKAISFAQAVAAKSPGGKTQAAAQLATFLTDAGTKAAAFGDVVAPTVVSRVATSSTLVTITFSEPMDQTVVPAASAFASAGNTIGARTWTSSTTLTVAGTGFAATEAFGYTRPVSNYLRDLAGNAVATTSANLT